MPWAGPGEVVIKNYAFAVNPIDWKVQDWGKVMAIAHNGESTNRIGIFLPRKPDQSFYKPVVLGADVAGEVHAVGAGVTHVKKGDRVMGYVFSSTDNALKKQEQLLTTYGHRHAFSLITKEARHGGFQLYTTCNALVVAKIPDSMPFANACTLPLSISTAAQCLFNPKTLRLPLPSLNPKPTDKTVVIWGASGCVGATAVQLATAAGVSVVAVASQKNFAGLSRYCKGDRIFDYKSPSLVRDIIRALRGTDFAGICDCVGTSDSVKAWTPIWKGLGGRYGSVLPPPANLPKGIEGENVYGPDIAHNCLSIGEAVWRGFLPAALENGALEPALKPRVFREGLEDLQDAVCAVKDGLSFEKAVIEVRTETPN
jgi:NADPH:quinone reductase-like Zn-dependent oxidoreductase